MKKAGQSAERGRGVGQTNPWGGQAGPWGGQLPPPTGPNGVPDFHQNIISCLKELYKDKRLIVASPDNDNRIVLLNKHDYNLHRNNARNCGRRR